ncbi:Ribonucleoside-diphosphate reductase subunit alpha [Frankliniella fusca]|uniref:Ribonucleoside-diphosphate reductase subunit alpha n=1 Tax=Frankliniella fusca TaxID=407009 RepID=A0AAE1LFI4_9NEOP|nr:Ribonucleoside-diphosphate reductase subunit alpha [Frankliniella fusca]
MLLNRNVRIKIPVPASHLKPSIPERIKQQLQEKQIKYQKYHDKTAQRRNVTFKTGDQVYTRSRVQHQWTPGQIVGKHPTPRSFEVLKPNGRLIRRNEAHLLPRKVTTRQTYPEILPSSNTPQIVNQQDIPEILQEVRNEDHHREIVIPNQGPAKTTRSGRVSKPVERLTL